MTKMMTQPQMAEFDARELAVYREMWKIEAGVPGIVNLIHRHAGDELVSNGWGKPKTWKMTDTEARGRLTYLASSYDYPQDPFSHIIPSDLLARIENVEFEIEHHRQVITDMETEYERQGSWNRYFPCLNADGHIHSTLRDCPTVRWDTDMGWTTEMSGLTPDQAIHGIEGQFEGLGETLCSVCFPDAPAEWCRTRSEVTRTEREAARAAKNAARDAKKAMKELETPFVCHDGDRERTVAGLKAVVRKAYETRVELEWARGEERKAQFDSPERYEDCIRNIEHRLAGEQDDSERACQVLIGREAAVPGSGWTWEDADKAIKSTVKRTRKAYFG